MWEQEFTGSPTENNPDRLKYSIDFGEMDMISINRTAIFKRIIKLQRRIIDNWKEYKIELFDDYTANPKKYTEIILDEREIKVLQWILGEIYEDDLDPITKTKEDV